jgi:probable HAF family extracellular repeat protein
MVLKSLISKITLILSISVALAVFARPAPAATYIVTNLGTLGGTSSQAHDINEAGQIVGSSPRADGLRRAFLWQDGVMTDLGTLSGSESWGYGINESGQIAGEALAFGQKEWKRAFLWQNGVMTDLGTLGGPYAFAWDINEAGQIVGSAAPDDFQGRAFLWQNGTMTNLGTLGGNASYAYGINDHTQVVGWARTDPNGTISEHAFLWSPSGGMTDLGTLGGARSQAWDINGAGDVVGFSQTADGVTWHAFLWTAPGGMTDLGTFGGAHSQAFAIDDHGRIVGYAYTAANTFATRAAFLWRNGVLVNLNDLVDPNLGWALNECRGINNLGQIVGYGTIGGQERAFALTPVYTLTIETAHGDWGRVEIAPEPNDGNAPAYRAGTVVTLTAIPIEGKAFKQWEIYDPNYPGDLNHITIDANNPLTLKMDDDYRVTAAFKCGSGGALPAVLLPAFLLALVLRRKA